MALLDQWRSKAYDETANKAELQKLWTAYFQEERDIYEELLNRDDDNTKFILINITTLIDGPYIESKRDITLKMRGSSNQRIINLTN